jgi:hypothetical protein
MTDKERRLREILKRMIDTINGEPISSEDWIETDIKKAVSAIELLFRKK